MEISNFSLLNTHSDKPIKLNTKTSAVDDRNYASVPSVSPAYYSPSFTATIRKEKPTIIDMPAYAKAKMIEGPNRETRTARFDIQSDLVNFLEDGNKYSDEEKSLILTSMFKDCTEENYTIPPRPDKEALDTTMDRYNASKEEGTSDGFDFNLEYRRELKLKDWRKNLFSDRVKYRPYDSIQIIRSLIENNEPEDIPPFDRIALDLTMRQKERKNNALTVSERENFDFNKEYKSNLKKFGFKDDGIFGFEDGETKYLREKYLRDEECDYSVTALSTYELKRLLETECNVKFPARSIYLTKALETPLVGGDIQEEKTSRVDVKDIEELSKSKSKETAFNPGLGSVILYKLMSCGNDNYAGFIEGLSDEEIKKAGFKTKIDLTAKRSSTKLSINSENGLTTVDFDIDKYGEYGLLWYNPVFKTKEGYEFTLNKNQEYYAKHRTLKENREAREEIKNKVDNYDSTCREFIDDFTTVIHYLNEGCCYFGCNHGNKTTNDMVLLDYFFNPKSDYGGQFVTLLDESDTGRYQTSRNFGLIAAGMKNLYDKLTPEDKKKMGWDEEFDKNFMPHLYETVCSLGQNEKYWYEMSTK